MPAPILGHYIFNYICNVKTRFLYTYRQKMFFSFILLFTIVVGTVAVFQHFYEKRLKTEQLQQTLVNYAEIVSNHIIEGDQDLSHLSTLFPSNLRITVIDTTGIVTFDNKAGNLDEIGNHIDRPEIQEAISEGKGFNIRFSNTLDHEYYYVAIKRHHLVVRTSMAFTPNLEKTYLRPERFFLIFSLALFVIIIFTLRLISSKLSRAIEALRDFSLQKTPEEYQSFPDDELGEIGRRILVLHTKNEIQKQRLQLEKDKLIKHFHYSDNGIAIFSSDKTLIYNNALFVQHCGIISPDHFEINGILGTRAFADAKAFVNSDKTSSYVDVMEIGERCFETKVIKFDDGSFELFIADITLAEKNRKIKREMTQNIAHELKTPVSTIKGYLETLQTVKVSAEKQQHFLERAKLQADRLSELVTDIAMITKMEESPNLYPKEKVLLNDIIEQATDSSKLKVIVKNKKNLPIIGSKNLLQTIFQNLIDNSNRYAGQDAEIHINCYLQDEEYYYFSVFDTGKGVPEKFLTRIFERFYRIDEGRNRNDGGTGLGLSLVKNAVLMHGGDIQAQNRKEGGLKFLFTLKKTNK